jgi:hypothetical protein
VRLFLFAFFSLGLMVLFAFSGKPGWGMVAISPGLLGALTTLWRIELLRKGEFFPFKGYLGGFLKPFPPKAPGESRGGKGGPGEGPPGEGKGG